MRLYRVFCDFGKDHFSLLMRHTEPYLALKAARGILQPGGRAYGIQEVR